MSRLKVTVPFHDDEHISSFCSRLALANHARNASEFCLHMGLMLSRVVGGPAADLDKLLTLADFRIEDVRNRIFVREGFQFLLNGESLSRSCVVRYPIRYCPSCLQEDSLTGAGPRRTRPYGRLTWQVVFIRTCSRHSLLLHDTQQLKARFDDDFSPIINAEMERRGFGTSNVVCAQTEFENYIQTRLWGNNTGSSWIDSLPLYVVGRVSEWAGMTLTHGRNFKSDELTTLEKVHARQQGFEIISGGKERFVDFLHSLLGIFWDRKGSVGGRVLYGRIYDRLAHESSDAAYAEIREIMRDTALKVLPLGPGDDMFGPIHERETYSIHSAAQELRVHPKTIRKLMSSKASIEEEAKRLTNDRTIIGKEKFAELADRIANTVSAEEARLYIDVSRSAWSAIVRGGFVKPVSRWSKRSYCRYKKDTLDAFVTKVLGTARLFVSRDSLVPISHAVNKTVIGYQEIYSLLLAGKLDKVATDSNQLGLQAVLIDIEEICEKSMLVKHGGLSLSEVENILHLHDKVLRALLKEGFISTECVINPKSRSRQRIVRADELDRFRSKYVSLFAYAKECGLHPTTIKCQMKEAGIAPAITRKLVGATFYRRDQLP
jgi:hypothetical protein